LVYFQSSYQIGDFSGQIINEVSALRHIRPPSTYLPLNNVQLVKIPERGVGRPRVRVMTIFVSFKHDKPKESILLINLNIFNRMTNTLNRVENVNTNDDIDLKPLQQFVLKPTNTMTIYLVLTKKLAARHRLPNKYQIKRNKKTIQMDNSRSNEREVVIIIRL